MNIQESKLVQLITPKQKLFCEYYLLDSDCFLNATKAYMKAYGLKGEKAYNTARANGARLLASANILEIIKLGLKNAYLNHTLIDAQLMKLIYQDDDPQAKLGAIREYNKINKRHTESEGGRPRQILFNLPPSPFIDGTLKAKEEKKRLLLEKLKPKHIQFNNGS